MNNRAMKDSGIEWIGEIPKDWEFLKLKNIVKITTGRRDANEGDLNGMYPFFTCSNIPIKINTYSFDTEALLIAGNGNVGHTQYFNGKFDAYQRVYVIHSFGKAIVVPFLKYYNSGLLKDYLVNKSNGSVIDFIKLGDLKNFNVLTPPLHEQQVIASYLDDKVNLLDQLIKNQQRVIEEWKAYKQSLITETVTKGLNPEVAFKDSGIEWIGNIPSHWEVIRLRTIGKTKSGLSNKTKEDFGIGNPFVSYGDVYRRDIIKATDFVNSTIDDISKFAINRGDVLFTGSSETIAELGMSSVALENIENSTYSGFLIRFRPESNKLLPEFSRFLFRSLSMREYLIQDDRSVTRSNLSQKKLKDMPTILPPLHEQQQIADFLDEKCSKIDQLIENKQRLIEDLKAYKQSLIYECVTGKKEIV